MATIPKLNSTVKWANKLFKLISCDMEGKCVLKKVNLPSKGKLVKGIDISEIEEA